MKLRAGCTSTGDGDFAIFDPLRERVLDSEDLFHDEHRLGVKTLVCRPPEIRFQRVEQLLFEALDRFAQRSQLIQTKIERASFSGTEKSALAIDDGFDVDSARRHVTQSSRGHDAQTYARREHRPQALCWTGSLTLPGELGSRFDEADAVAPRVLCVKRFFTPRALGDRAGLRTVHVCAGEPAELLARAWYDLVDAEIDVAAVRLRRVVGGDVEQRENLRAEIGKWTDRATEGNAAAKNSVGVAGCGKNHNRAR